MTNQLATEGPASRLTALRKERSAAAFNSPSIARTINMVNTKANIKARVTNLGFEIQ
jgi:hypothetical protein